MYKIEEKSLSIVLKKLKKLFGKNLILLVAFGSRVRGDFHGESDFDVLVVVKKKNYDILRKMIDVFYEEEEKTGIAYSVIIRDEETFEKEKKFKTGFYFNILYEGRVIYGKINP